MIGTSAVAMSDTDTLPVQSGVKCAALPPAGREREQPEQRDGAELGDRDQVHQGGRGTDADIVEDPHHDDRRRGDVPHGGWIEAEEVPEVLGEDRRDGAEGRRADHGQLGPAEEKGRDRPERLEQEREDATRPGERRRQLREGQRAGEGHDAAQHPGQDHRSRHAQRRGHAGRHPEDAAADRAPDQDGDGAPESQAARQSLAPDIGGSAHGKSFGVRWIRRCGASAGSITGPA